MCLLSYYKTKVQNTNRLNGKEVQRFYLEKIERGVRNLTIIERKKRYDIHQ